MLNATPQHIGRYEIVEPLATGGMATVYLARLSGPAGFTKLFALKTIHPHLIAEDGFIEMFLDEARIAARIAHPNVCQIVDFGVGTGSYFIAMELLLGENLGVLQKQLDSYAEGHAELVARIVADAAEGLHAAHEVTDDDGKLLHVVHRDISQSNLLVTFDGVVKVVDFGIASAADQLHLTRTGTLKGKFAYMAPEQLEQQATDRRADVWSLGVVMWELLTGERLFKRKRQVDSMRAVLDDPIPQASTVNPNVPPEMDTILARALDRRPDNRYSSALEMAQALDELGAKRGWTLSGRDLGEQVRKLCGDSFERQSTMVVRARSASSPVRPEATSGANGGSDIESKDDVTQTRRARSTLPANTSEEPAASPEPAPPLLSQPSSARSSSPSSEPTKKSRWTSVFALVVVAGIAAAAYFAGSQAGPTGPTREGPMPGPVATQSDGPADPEDTTLADTTLADTTNDGPPDAIDEQPEDVEAAVEAPEPADDEPVDDESAEEAATDEAAAMQRRRAAGFVNITTPGGWADVLVGGRNVGRTPLRTRLPAGRRRVVLRPFGRGSVRRTVTVRPREATRLVVPVNE